MAVNASGQVVGYSATAGNAAVHAFSWTQEGGMIDLGTLGGTDSQANAVNASGQVVGYSFLPGDTITHAVLWQVSVEVDTTPPVITAAASPETLWPPNGQLVPVTVSGTITDEPGGSGVSSTAYTVIDEYGQVQPSGSVPLGADGRYAFTVALQASRRGNDPDGRHYLIAVSATDKAGNRGSAPATVTVPRN